MDKSVFTKTFPRILHKIVFFVLMLSLVLVGFEANKPALYLNFKFFWDGVHVFFLLVLVAYCVLLFFALNRSQYLSRLFFAIMAILLSVDVLMSLGAIHVTDKIFSLFRILLFFVFYYHFFQESSLHRLLMVIYRCQRQIFSIVFLLLTLLYTASIIGFEMLSETDPQFFGTLKQSFITFFRVMLGNDLGVIIQTVEKQHPYSPFLFILFIMLSGFIILNLFVSVLVNAFSLTVKEKYIEQNKKLKDQK